MAADRNRAAGHPASLAGPLRVPEQITGASQVGQSCEVEKAVAFEVFELWPA